MISGKYSIDFTDKIVFMEELFLETPPALVSNYFYHMKQNGIFDRIKGIWLGNYDGSVAIEKILIDTIGNELCTLCHGTGDDRGGSGTENSLKNKECEKRHPFRQDTGIISQDKGIESLHRQT